MKRSLILAPVLMAIATPAFAHPGVHHGVGFMAGLLHPLSGVDHMLAMTAVGLFASVLGGRALWLLPLAFIGAMVLGAGLGAAQLGLPMVEMGIAVSVISLGVLIAANLKLPMAFAAVLVSAFAVFHGYAHGSEAAQVSSEMAYGAGFVASTATLHALGVALGLTGRRLQAEGGALAVRFAGGLFALAGAGVITGVI